MLKILNLNISLNSLFIFSIIIINYNNDTC